MANRKLKSRYRVEHGQTLIEIRLRQSRQLFDNLDPSPYVERDLNADTVDYLVESVGELSPKQPFMILIHMSHEDPDSLSADDIRSAIHSFFEYQVVATEKRIQTFFRRGRSALFLGLILLAFGLIGGHLLSTRFEGQLTARVMSEGLIIIGWVAMWKPLELILYDWWPLLDERRIFRALCRCHIEVLTDRVP